MLATMIYDSLNRLIIVEMCFTNQVHTQEAGLPSKASCCMKYHDIDKSIPLYNRLIQIIYIGITEGVMVSRAAIGGTKYLTSQ